MHAEGGGQGEEEEEEADSDGDDFNVQLDAPDMEAYEAQQMRAAEESAKKAEAGGEEGEEDEEDDDFNVFLDDPSQGVMGGPEGYAPQSSAHQYIRCPTPSLRTQRNYPTIGGVTALWLAGGRPLPADLPDRPEQHPSLTRQHSHTSRWPHPASPFAFPAAR